MPDPGLGKNHCCYFPPLIYFFFKDLFFAASPYLFDVLRSLAHSGDDDFLLLAPDFAAEDFHRLLQLLQTGEKRFCRKFYKIGAVLRIRIWCIFTPPDPCYLLSSPPWPSWSAWRTSLVSITASRLPSSPEIARVLLFGVALSLRYATLKLPATERFLTFVGILFQSFAAR
jgi:hypothetical protein